jgi:fucose permease
VNESEDSRLFKRDILVICLCGFSIGQIGTFNSPAGPEIQEAWHLTDWQSNVFNAQAHFFASVGGFGSELVISRLGRKKPSIILMIGVVIGFAIIATTQASFFWRGFGGDDDVGAPLHCRICAFAISRRIWIFSPAFISVRHFVHEFA